MRDCRWNWEFEETKTSKKFTNVESKCIDVNSLLSIPISSSGITILGYNLILGVRLQI